MRDFTKTANILAPADRVWSVMIDVRRWSEWTPSITSIDGLDGSDLVVGARFRIRQPRFPEAVWQVIDVQPGRSFSWAYQRPGIRVVGYHAVEETAPGSRAVLRLTLDGFLGGLMGIFTGGITKRYLALEIAGLKARSQDPGFRYDWAQPLLRPRFEGSIVMPRR